MSAVAVFSPKVDRRANNLTILKKLRPGRRGGEGGTHVEGNQARKEGGHPCKGGINSFTLTTDCRQQVNPACFNSLSASADFLDFDHKVAAT